MKKLILMLALLSTTTVTYSQKRFNLTFIASPQMSWLRSDSKEIKGSKSFLGFGYGVEGDIFLGSDNYSITTGITVSSTGGSLTYSPALLLNDIELPADTKIDYLVTYLEMPLAMKMRTRDFNRTRYFAQFGLTNWFNIRSRASSSDGIFQKEAIKGEMRFCNIGLNLGVGLEFDLGSGNALTYGLIYSNSFTDATNNTAIKESTTLRVVRFRLGFVF